LSKSKTEYIETYIFAPDLLSREEKIEVELWLRESDALRAVADRYSAFKKEIRFIEKSKAKKRPENSRIKLFPSKVVKKRKHSFTLAAKTPEVKTGKSGIQTLRTFISEENKAIVRVIRENDENELQIHAISENIDFDDIAMLRIPGVTDLMISKPGGIFLTESSQFSDEMVKKWESCMLFIPLDRADLLINPETGGVFLDTHRSDKEKFFVTVSKEESLIKIHFNHTGDFDINKVIVSDGERGYLILMNDNVIDLPGSLIKNGLVSLFFFN
jgi:hypothetical protein